MTDHAMKASAPFAGIAVVLASLSLDTWALGFALAGFLLATVALTATSHQAKEIEKLAHAQREQFGRIASQVGTTDKPDD